MSPVVTSGDVSCWLRGVPSFMFDTDRQADTDRHGHTQIQTDTQRSTSAPLYIFRQANRQLDNQNVSSFTKQHRLLFMSAMQSS